VHANVLYFVISLFVLCREFTPHFYSREPFLFALYIIFVWFNFVPLSFLYLLYRFILFYAFINSFILLFPWAKKLTKLSFLQSISILVIWKPDKTRFKRNHMLPTLRNCYIVNRKLTIKNYKPLLHLYWYFAEYIMYCLLYKY